MRPIIGIMLDWAEHGSFSKWPHYALKQQYFDTVYACGGLPVGIPPVGIDPEEFLDRIDGLLVPGGDYPSPGWWYGDDHGTSDHPRAETDVRAIRAALARDMPLLGICAGHQTLAVATGGKLIWSVKRKPGAMDHRKILDYTPAHVVTLEPDSLLARVAGCTQWETNSLHNEAVVEVGAGIRVTGKTEDGVIEAIEAEGKTFAIGVQWHPEFTARDQGPDRKLFEGFIAAAAARALRKAA